MSTVTRWIVAGEPKNGNNHKMITCTSATPSTNSNDWQNITKIGIKSWKYTREVKYGNNLWVAVGKGIISQSTAKPGHPNLLDYPIIISNDGINWRKPANLGHIPDIYHRLEGFSVEYNQGHWVMCGRLNVSSAVGPPSKSSIMLHSTDGENWTPLLTVTSLGSHILLSVKWLENRWVAIGNANLNITNGNQSKVIVCNSVDPRGVWTKSSVFMTFTPQRLSGNANYTYIMSSESGVLGVLIEDVATGLWTYHIPSNNLTYKRRDLEKVGTRYFAVGEGNSNNPILYTSNPSGSWTTASGGHSSVGPIANAVNGFGSNVLVGGDTGRLARSTNMGNNFTEIFLSTNKQLGRIHTIGYSLN